MVTTEEVALTNQVTEKDKGVMWEIVNGLYDGKPAGAKKDLEESLRNAVRTLNVPWQERITRDLNIIDAILAEGGAR